MIINGKDRGFFYSVGAHLAIGDLALEKAKKNGSIRAVVQSAVIMNKAFEDRKALEDPDYKPEYLTLAEVELLPLHKMRELSAETDAAMRAGLEIETETIPKKNTVEAE